MPEPYGKIFHGAVQNSVSILFTLPTWPIFQLFQLFVHFFHMFFIFEKNIFMNSRHSEVDLEFWFLSMRSRICFQMVDGRWRSHCWTNSSLSSISTLGARMSSLVLDEMLSDDACCGCCNCDCCCVWHSSPRVTLGAGRSVGGLSGGVRSPCWEVAL